MRTKEKSNYLKFVSKSLANLKEGKKRNFISKNPLFYLICKRFAGKSMFENFFYYHFDNWFFIHQKQSQFSLPILVVLTIEKEHKKRLTEDESAYFICHLVRLAGIEPVLLSELDPKSSASASSAIAA